MSNLSFVRHVGDGTTRQFTLSTAGTNIGYFRTEDIHAYVNDVEVTFTINAASPHLVVLDEAPALGADVLLRREMPVTTPYANFERGNNFGHRQVNNSFIQQLYLTQEMLDGFAPEGYYLKQELNMGVHKIVNMQRASATGEAVEHDQWDEHNVVQDSRLTALEQSLTAGNLVYRRVVFTATEGQTEFNPNAVFGGILNLYVNGINQIAGEAYESVDGRIIKTVPLDEGDRVVAIIGQEPQFSEPEQTDFRYVRYPFFATGGETTYVLPADAKQVMSLYINGTHQTYQAAFEFDNTTNTVTFAEPLEGGDEVVVYAGSEPVVEGDASNLPATSISGLTKTLRSWVQGLVDFGKNLVTPTGSTHARTLDDRLADTVNVKDFGAEGGGLVDETLALKQSIQNGGKVALAGEHLTTAALNLQKYSTLSSCKESVLKVGTGSVGLEASAATTQPLYSNIQGFRIEGEGKADTGSVGIRHVGDRNVAYNTYEGLRISELETGLSLSAGWGNVFSNCDFRSCKRGIEHKTSTFQPGWAGSGQVFMGGASQYNDYGVYDEGTPWCNTYMNMVFEGNDTGVFHQGYSTIFMNCWWEGSATKDIQIERGLVLLGGRMPVWTAADVSIYSASELITKIDHTEVLFTRGASDGSNSGFEGAVLHMNGEGVKVLKGKHVGTSSEDERVRLLGSCVTNSSDVYGASLECHAGYYDSRFEDPYGVDSSDRVAAIDLGAIRNAGGSGSSSGVVDFNLKTNVSVGNGGNQKRKVLSIKMDSVASGVDNEVDLGTPSEKFKTVYVSTIDASSLNFANVPTTDPHVTGQLWNNSGIMTISAG